MRFHLQAGQEITVFDEVKGYVVLTGFFLDTDGTNDAVLKITDKDGHVLPTGGFTVMGYANSGGATVMSEECWPPVKASLSGSGSTAVLYYVKMG